MKNRCCESLKSPVLRMHIGCMPFSWSFMQTKAWGDEIMSIWPASVNLRHFLRFSGSQSACFQRLFPPTAFHPHNFRTILRILESTMLCRMFYVWLSAWFGHSSSTGSACHFLAKDGDWFRSSCHLLELNFVNTELHCVNCNHQGTYFL